MCIGVFGPAEEAIFFSAARWPGPDVIELPRALEREAAPDTDIPRPGSNGLLLNREEVASLLGVSRSHLTRMNNRGLLIRALKLGRATRWYLGSLLDWLEAGAPPRDKWETWKQHERSHRRARQSPRR